jgi:RHS repeat-associated protein
MKNMSNQNSSPVRWIKSCLRKVSMGVEQARTAVTSRMSTLPLTRFVQLGATAALGAGLLFGSAAQAANTPPTVTLYYPFSGSTAAAGGTLAIWAIASDTDGIAKVEFYDGTTLIGTSTTTPTATLSWTNVPAGVHAITAKAYDKLGAVSTSAVNTVTIAGSATVTSTTRITSISPASPVPGQNVTVNVQVSGQSTFPAQLVLQDNGSPNYLAAVPPNGLAAFTISSIKAGVHNLTVSYAGDTVNKPSSTTAVLNVGVTNVAPTVSLTGPVSGSSYTAPASVVITATAADSDGTVAKVEYYNGTTLLGTSTAAPYSFTWSNVAVGSYSLTAKATDNTGAVTTSAAVAVTVKAANVAPTVSLTGPVSGSSYTAPASVVITATAADSDGTVAKVEYYNGTTLLGTSTAAPYSFTWANVAAGSYSLTAKAYDNLGAVTTGAASAITVKAGNAAPTVSLTAPAANATYIAPAAVTITATAADSDGTIAKVEYYNGATLLGASTAAPYSFIWSNVAAGTYSLTAKAYDNSGAVTTSAAAAITVKSANVAPSVNLISPAANATYSAPAVVALTATAADSDGSISKVEFYNAGVLLGTVTAGVGDPLLPAGWARYQFNWSNVAAGSYQLMVRVYDNTGAVTTSSTVAITVKAANVAPTVSLTAPAANASYTAPAAVTITANAADSDGTIAKVEYYNGAILLGTSTVAPYSYTWSNVAAGSYQVMVKAYDNAGAVTTSAGILITVKAANAAPTVSLTAPAANASYTAPATVTITATAADSDGTVAKVEYYNGTTLLGTSTVAPYSFTWSNVAAGSYSLTAKATDNTGAVTTSAAVAITIKAANAAPAVSLTAPAANASYTAPAAVTITATAADSDGTVAKVEYYNGATLLGTSTAAPYSFTWSNVAAGSYSLTAKATDNTGAVTTSAAVAITVKAANAAPTVSLTAPAANASYTAPAAVTITATAVDSDGTVAKVEYYNGTTLLGTSTAAPYSFTWSNVAAGSYSLTAKATDNTGAVTTSAAVAITVKAANVTPTVSLTAPAANASYTAPASVVITATAADSDGTVAKVEYYNGTTLLGTSTVAPYSFTWSNVAVGSYSLTAKATDNTGAVTTSAAVAITVKAATVAPTVSLTAPAASAVYTAPAAVTITATAADSDGSIAKVEFYNGTTLLNSSTTAPYSYTWNSVAAGTYSLTAKATDNAGATTTSTAVTITVNPGGLYFIHTDHLGTPRLIADQAKKTIWRWDNQEPFGQTGLQEDPDADGKTFTFNLRFAGQYYDQESGLHYNRNRDYDPATGRYVQADPIGLSGGISLYGYVSGNPLRFVDPLGLAAVALNTPGYSVYGLFKPGAETPYYVGHTNQELSARLGQHAGTGRANASTEIRSLTGATKDLTYTQAKGYEQAYVEHYDTKTGGEGNRINPIDKTRTDARGQSHVDNYNDKADELKNGKCK